MPLLLRHTTRYIVNITRFAMFNPITQDEFNPEEFIQVLDNEQPYIWKAWRGTECEAVKLYRANPWKQTNRIIVHHEAMLWHSFHNPETWDGVELEADDEGVVDTGYSCPINYDEYIRTTVWHYFGGR